MKDNRNNPSRTSPREGRRACLCGNGTYSRKCCKGNMINQGIGRTKSAPKYYLRQEDFELLLQENNHRIII
jgi:hypothetical protein